MRFETANRHGIILPGSKCLVMNTLATDNTIAVGSQTATTYDRSRAFWKCENCPWQNCVSHSFGKLCRQKTSAYAAFIFPGVVQAILIPGASGSEAV